MGKTRKCTYRLELSYVCFKTRSKQITVIGLMRKDIKPTIEGTKQYRDSMNQSIINGTNKHLNGLMSLYSNATLINQNTGEKIIYKAPMFEVI